VDWRQALIIQLSKGVALGRVRENGCQRSRLVLPKKDARCERMACKQSMKQASERAHQQASMRTETPYVSAGCRYEGHDAVVIQCLITKPKLKPIPIA